MRRKQSITRRIRYYLQELRLALLVAIKIIQSVDRVSAAECSLDAVAMVNKNYEEV